MSRIGKKPVTIPSGVTAKLEGQKITISGPNGTLSQVFEPVISVSIDGQEIHIKRADDEKHTKQLHGTTRALIAGMITGVSKGYSKQLELKGIGFHAAMKGKDIELTVGYSHPVVVPARPNTKITIAADTTSITVSGCDKQAVGEVAAEIHQVREPEPYLGKGIAYKGERIRRKEGKKAGK